MDPEASTNMAVDLPSVKTDDVPTVNHNGIHIDDNPEISIEQLEAELPVVFDSQIPLGELLSRVVQSIYTELTEMSETLPNMSDSARKRTLADWVVKTKKQVVKLYAIAKWSRDADIVQKCMNITAFLMDQNRQFEDAIHGLNYARESLDPARLRNHDLLTSLDVLTTGSYRRLPTVIKKSIIPPVPLTDPQVIKTLTDIQDAIQYRLRLAEIVPVEMSRHRIADGRVYFMTPKLFECSLSLQGAQPRDPWIFIHVEFLMSIGGDLNTTQEFPRKPSGVMHQFIKEEAERQLRLYDQKPEPLPFLMPGVEPPPPPPELPEGITDSPLVRLFNFLQMMSLSYQMEVLWYQATRMRSLGWADFLTVNITPNRKILTVSYWIRKPSTNRQIARIPTLGGSVTISIIQSTHKQGERSPRAKILAELQHASKLGLQRTSDNIEFLKFDVRWEPTPNALGLPVPPEEYVLPEGVLSVDADNLDFEGMLDKIVNKHIQLLLSRVQVQLQHNGIPRSVFSGPGVVTRIEDGRFQALKVLLCADKYILVSIDPRTGRFTLRNVGDLSAATQDLRLSVFVERINEAPFMIMNLLIGIRLRTILELVEQKASYLGLQSFQTRNFAKNETAKLGNCKGMLYIRLENHHTHYLVIIITDEEFRYALITTQVLPETVTTNMVMEDIAWLDFARIRGDEITITAHSEHPDAQTGMKRKRKDETLSMNDEGPVSVGFHLETQVLRELYSFCCARVAYMNVERQLKIRGIPFTHVNPTTVVSPELAYIQSSLARSVPGLCVQSSDILSGAPAAEAAMPNIRVIPLNWWSEKKAQVVTCVKLKYVQQPMGKTAGTSTVIRPSKRIIYDTTEAVVSFLSENVNTCVDEFLEEWARVSKMVVIAREVAQMSKEKTWPDIRLLSFDLQTVEFAYAEDYTVSITCEDQLSPTGGNFDLRFSRAHSILGHPKDGHEAFNPHDAEPYLRSILRHGHGRLAPSLHRLVRVLRDTLPIVVELEAIRQESERANTGKPVDTFAKAAGWFRLLYSDLRHALDFRSMTGERVVILDASHSLYSSPPNQFKGEEIDSSGDTIMADQTLSDLLLQPIPGFSTTVTECVREAIASGHAVPGQIIPIDIGIICKKAVVKSLMRSIHNKVSAKLAGS